MALSECYLTKAIHCTITLHLAYTSIRARALRVSYATGVFFFLLFFFFFFRFTLYRGPVYVRANTRDISTTCTLRVSMYNNHCNHSKRQTQCS